MLRRSAAGAIVTAVAVILVPVTASRGQQEVAAEITRKDAADSKWEWKTPIEFFGHVVDENGRPISGVEIHFQWTDISAHGTSEADISSDANGDFKLSGVAGKRLVVRLHKAGYYTSLNENQFSFEFSTPYEENFYKPDSARPVTFHLRKHGDARPLVARKVKIMIPLGQDTVSQVDLRTGAQSPAGEFTLTVSKPQLRAPFPYDWQVALTMRGGGFVEHGDEFPFEAPENGYQSTIGYPQHAKNGMSGVALEKSLYFVFSNGIYGRINLRTDGNSRYVFLDYVFNPTVGDRNLEFDPAKQMKAP